MGMGIVAWVVVGAFAGFIATFILGNREGILMTVVLGIVGAVVGGLLVGAFLERKGPMGIDIETVVVSVIGAVIVVSTTNLVLDTGRSPRRRLAPGAFPTVDSSVGGTDEVAMTDGSSPGPRS